MELPDINPPDNFYNYVSGCVVLSNAESEDEDRLTADRQTNRQGSALVSGQMWGVQVKLKS